MTGYFVRVERESKFQSVEIDQLTDAELVDFFLNQNIESSRKWAIALIKWIRDNVKGE